MNTKKCLNVYLELFLTMFKIGACTFGGGYAMIALLENELVEKKKWIEREEFLDMVAISESTPGPVAVNSATYIGYKMGGVFGSACATLGVVIPSFVIIFMISLFFDQFLSLSYVGYAFKGIQVCVVYLILSAGFKLMKQLETNVFHMTIMVAVLVAMLACSLFAVKFSSIFYIFICGTIGVIVYLITNLKTKGGTDK